MNALQIDYFLTVAQNLSFSKSAAELNVSQPAISRQIIALERELGTELFERSKRRIRLTESGEMFYRFFGNYKTELNGLKLRAQMMAGNKLRTVHIGVLNCWNAARFMKPVIREFYQIYDNIQIQLSSYELGSAQQAVLSDREDIILTIEPQNYHIKDIVYESAARIPSILLFAADHALAGQRQLTPFDFKEEQFLVAEGEDAYNTKDLVQSFCRPYGFVPKVQIVGSTDAMINGVQCGLGVCVLDSLSRVLDSPSFKHIELKSKHEVSILWKPQEADDSVKKIVELLHREMEKIG